MRVHVRGLVRAPIGEEHVQLVQHGLVVLAVVPIGELRRFVGMSVVEPERPVFGTGIDRRRGMRGKQQGSHGHGGHAQTPLQPDASCVPQLTPNDPLRFDWRRA